MDSKLFDLNNKVAVITGAGGGVGGDISIALAEHGANVILTERPGAEANLMKCKEKIQEMGREALITTLDVTNIESIKKMVATIKKQFKKIDILINNAGVSLRAPSLEVTEKEWDLVQDVNLKGTFFTSQEVAKVMKENGGGKIINVSSIHGINGFHERAAYCSSKAGVVNLTKVLAIDWAEHGINVNGIGPNYMVTPLTKGILEDKEFHDDVIYRTPLRKIGKPNDLSGGIVYLASPSSDFVTGHTLMVDGGWTAW